MDNTRPMWNVYTANPWQPDEPPSFYFNSYGDEQKAKDVTRGFIARGFPARYREATGNQQSEWRQ